MKYALLAISCFALPLFAHPMDDKAEMQFEARIMADDSIELHFEFRYKDPVAVATELGSRLDLDGDGQFNKTEIRQRFLAHSDETLLGLSISIDGEAVFAQPELERCRFWDLENPDTPVTLDTSTFGYALVFSLGGKLDAPIKVTFSGQQSVVHTPALQLLAFDNRGPERLQLPCEYSEKLAVFPWLEFTALTVFESTEPDVQPAENDGSSLSAAPDDPANETNWLYVVLSGVFGIAGLVSGVQAVRKRRAQFVVYAGLFWLIATAIFWRAIG